MLLKDFVRHLICDRGPIFFVLVVECQLCPSGNDLKCEKGDVVDTSIRMVLGNCEESTIWLTRVIHES